MPHKKECEIMSTVSGVGDSGLDWRQLIAQLNRQQQAQQSGRNAEGGQTGPDQSVSAVGQHHHRHHHGGGEMFKKIEAAVTSALQSADSSADPNKVVEDAIATIFQGESGGTNESVSDGQSTDGTNASGQTQSSSKADRQAFLDFLQQHGISADRFRQDFMAAVKEAQAGQPNAATAFQSFPPGTTVDAQS
jgi:hypothetical protein